MALEFGTAKHYQPIRKKGSKGHLVARNNGKIDNDKIEKKKIYIYT